MFDPKAFTLYSEAPNDAICPNGERLADGQERMLAAIRLIGERHSGEIVAAVTHAVMIRLAVAKLTGLSGTKWRIPVGRGSLTRFEVVGDEIQVVDLPAGDDVD
jgi:broad specificity phosphatase PhoE